MTHLWRKNNNCPNKVNGILKKKPTSDPNLAQVNEENETLNSNLKADDCQQLTTGQDKGKNSKVSFVFPRGSPIMSWFVDSGASEHMVNSEEYFDDSQELERPTRVVVAKSGVELKATRVGTVRGHSIVNGQRVEYTFRDVLFVPDLQANLFSVAKAVSLKLKVIFENSICKIVKRDKEVAIAIRDDKLYELKILLHSMYRTPSVTVLRPKKWTNENTRTRKHSVVVVAEPPAKSTSTASKKHSCHMELSPKQKVHLQEL